MFQYPQGMTEKDIHYLRQLAFALTENVSVTRAAAHDAFDPIWQSGKMTRTAAYAWLAEQMGVSFDDCHMEKFSAEQCRNVIEICRD